MPSSTFSSTTPSSSRPFSAQHAVERLGLRHGAREAVEDEAVAGIRLVDAIGDDRNDDVVRDEIAPVHDVLGLESDRRSGPDRGAQHVAGGELHNPVFGDQALRLGALPGPRRAEQYQSHLRRPRSFDFLISPSYWCASR